MTTKIRSRGMLAGCVLLALNCAHAQSIAGNQPLGEALSAFAKQTGLQLIYVSDDASGRIARPVGDGLSPAEALGRMLEGTGLAYEFINDRTVRIYPTKQLTSSRGAGAAGNPGSFIRVAAVDSTLEGQGAVATANTKESLQVEEVLVTGTHISGSKEPTAPTLVITRGEIEKTGYTSVEGLIQELPQNFSSVSVDSSLSAQAGRSAMGNGVARGAAVDLRGLGPESTLTLLNGKRIAAGSGTGKIVDVSVIPLSLIERVEVVTGGQSAIYGADAVAGVANFITRREFDGFETQLSHSFGSEHDGGERWQFSQVAGYAGERLGLAASYDYSTTEALDLMELGLIAGGLPGREVLALQSVPKQRLRSVFLSGRYGLSDAVEIVGDAFYSQKESRFLSSELYAGADLPSVSSTNFTNDEHGVTLGALVGLGGGWSLDVSGVVSEARTEYVLGYDVNYPGFSFKDAMTIAQNVGTQSFKAVAEGSLPNVFGIVPRTAVGIEYRGDDLESISGGRARLYDRNIKSAFAELLLPLVTDGPSGMRAVEATIAARYDDFSDVGSTFNPQGGLAWRISDQFKMQAAFTRAFRAPGLTDPVASGYHSAIWVNDPSSGADVPVLLLGGVRPGLKPETARSWSVGFDFEPEFARRTRLSASYFSIHYRDRLERPLIGSADEENLLRHAVRYPGQLTFDLSAAQVAEAMSSDSDGMLDNLTGMPLLRDGSNLLSLFPNAIMFDNRLANIAVQKVSGIDAGANVEWDGAQSVWSFGLNATYTLEHDRYVTASSPAIEAINGVGKPVSLRSRASLGWNRSALGAYLYLNYLDGYSNDLPFAVSDVSSWTTMNFTLRFSGSVLGKSSMWNGLSAALSADNLLDKDPPRVVGSSVDGLLYDPMNANPMGRTVTLRLTKRW